MRRLSLHVVASWIALGATLGACGSSADISGADVSGADVRLDEPIEVVAPPLCTDRQVSIRHVAAWPGGGVGVRLRVEATSVDESGLLVDGALALGPANGDAIPAAVALAAPAPGFVLMVVEGDDDARTAAAEFVAALPAGTRVGLFQRCARLRQVAGVSDDRARLGRLVRGAEIPCSDTPLPWAEAVEEAAGEAFGVGGRRFPAERALVVLTEGIAPDAAAFADLPMGVDGYLVAPGAESLALPAGAEGFDLSSEAAARVVKRLDERARRTLQAGACLPPASGGPLALRFASGTTCPLPAAEGPAEEQILACATHDITAGTIHTPSRIELIFTPAEQAIFDQLWAAKSHDDFAVTVRIGDADPVAAVAHLRGATTINCKRKSFTVDLDGGAARMLGPGFADDEFHLISMCSDDRYFQQFTANQLMASLGLFPMRFDLTELVIDGETRGVYELIEKPKQAALESTTRLKTIVRRRNDYRDEAPDIEYPSGLTSDSPEIAPYWALLDELAAFQGDELVAEARSRFDLEGYLTLVAFHAFLQTGDFADETYFYSTESAVRTDLDSWFRVHAWDMDDLYSACHHEGQYAIVDEHELLYCAEGDLEKLLLADPAVYALFVDALDGLIEERLSVATVEAALDATAARLLPFFDRPGLPAAMVELVGAHPEAKDGEVAKADIQAAIEQTKSDFRARRDELRNKIAAWRQLR
jgi:hypothetical protein